MGDIGRTVISLRFFGDDLDPQALSNAFGARPTMGVKTGGICRTPKGTEVVARTGSWL